MTDIFESGAVFSESYNLKGVARWGRVLSLSLFIGCALLIAVLVVASSLPQNQQVSFAEFYGVLAIVIPMLIPAGFLFLASNNIRKSARDSDGQALEKGLGQLKYSLNATAVIAILLLALIIGTFAVVSIVEPLQQF